MLVVMNSILDQFDWAAWESASKAYEESLSAASTCAYAAAWPDLSVWASARNAVHVDLDWRDVGFSSINASQNSIPFSYEI